ncbi:MAG: hypothetical protein JWM68_4146 [Verrucomicrobiales bacterium]|nr:hypothetical protein [Verrucomicrobiales bacterium]
MQNPIAKNMNGQVATAKKLAVGSALLGPAAMPHNTEPLITAQVTAAERARQNCETGRGVLRGLRAAMETARLAGRALAMFVRDVLKPIFGTEYTQAWDVTGHVGSLEIPASVDDLIVLLNTQGLFLTANPTLEIPVRNITAAQLQIIGDALADAQAAVITQEATVGELLAARDAAFEALVTRIRGTMDECAQVLSPLDPRWKAFGLNMPGAEQTPEPVDGLMATLIGPNAGALKWNAPARAKFYHVFQRIVGVDADYVLVASPDDPDCTLEALPANASIDIQVSAVNDGGEGQRSDTVTIVTH